MWLIDTSEEHPCLLLSMGSLLATERGRPASSGQVHCEYLMARLAEELGPARSFVRLIAPDLSGLSVYIHVPHYGERGGHLSRVKVTVKKNDWGERAGCVASYRSSIPDSDGLRDRTVALVAVELWGTAKSRESHKPFQVYYVRWLSRRRHEMRELFWRLRHLDSLPVFCRRCFHVYQGCWRC